jgi:hypothetical protein
MPYPTQAQDNLFGVPGAVFDRTTAAVKTSRYAYFPDFYSTDEFLGRRSATGSTGAAGRRRVSSPLSSVDSPVLSVATAPVAVDVPASPARRIRRNLLRTVLLLALSAAHLVLFSSVRGQ